MKLHSPIIHRSQRAFSLVEIMVATAVAMILFAAVGSLTLFTTRSFVAMGYYNDLDRISCKALDRMSREIRSTRYLTNFTTTKLTFQDYDNTPLVFEFSPTARTLVRKKGTANTTLLTQCDLLAFHISQRNPSNNFS